MSNPRRPGKSILRRRQSLSSDIEAVLGGSSVILLSYLWSLYDVGAFRVLDLLWLLSLLAAMTLTYDMLGVYRRHAGLPRKIFNLTRAWTLAFGMVLVLAYALGMLPLFSRAHLGGLFFAGLFVQLLLHSGLELAHRKWMGASKKQNALIIGTGWLADYIKARINSNPWIPERVVGALSVPSSPSNPPTAVERSDLQVLGTIEDIDSVLDSHGIRTVYVITTLETSPVLQQLYFKLLNRSINIHWVPNIFALHLINHNVKELAGIPIITLSESPLSGRLLVVKNIEDKLLAVLGILLAIPVMLVVAIAIKLDSPGPLLFVQERTGWDGKVFKIWKFRTMRVHDAPEGVVEQATRNDPRVTRVGSFLRRSSLDELPQLFNVLAGSMSLVGPRPHAIQHDDLYSAQIDAYLARHRIKPGITGLAQVRGFRGETKDVRLMAERVKHDIEYINNWSLMLDISILARTLTSLLSSRAY
jgi:putative colanic acid biosynthesis UDP-glucose lipid carrier transferase